MDGLKNGAFVSIGYIAKENYKIEIDTIDNIINEAKKRKITLTESELFNLITESCKDVLNNINNNN